MELVIPDGAQIQITIGHPPPLALAHDTRPTLPATARSRGGRILKGLGAAAIVIVAFQAGRLLPPRTDTASAAQATSAPMPARSAGERGAAAEIPSAFRAQLAQPPQVIPPPGNGPPARAPDSRSANAPVPGTSAPSNPFGLLN